MTRLSLVIFLVLGSAVGLTNRALAFSPEAYPGFTWAKSGYDLNGIEGYGTQGFVNQGVQWMTLPGGIPLVTYGSYHWRFRAHNNTYYDAHGPTVGLGFSKYFFNWGAEYDWQSYPSLHETTRNFSLFLIWFKTVDFLSGEHPSVFGIPVLGFPTSSWGRVNDDFDHLEGFGTMGFVSQAIEWFTLPAEIVFRTQALYSWRFRTQNHQFYNVHGPGVGIELGRKTLNLGVEYDWQHYTALKQDTHDFRLYLTWYFDWDLKKSSVTN